VQPDFSTGKVYAVLFWGTKAQASRRAMLQFGELRNRYAGQVHLVIFTNEQLDDATSYITNRGMRWEQVPVGSNSDKKSWDNWMKASGQSGEFALFLVDKQQRLVWGGDPGDIDLSRILDLVLADRYDPVLEEKARPAVDAARRAAKIRNYSEAYMHYDTAVNLNPALFSNVALEKYKFMITEARDPKAGAEYGKSLITLYADNPSALVDLAVMIMTDPDIKERDTELAETAAKRVYAVSAPAPRPSDPSVLSRLATYQFEVGKTKEAIELQMEAWMIAPESAKPAHKTKLDQLRAAAKAKDAAAAKGAATGTP
jgi:tetratricopeptide (TPR) repeat protein